MTVEPQYITYDGTPPTFNPVSSTDYIDIYTGTFIYLHNGSSTDDVIVISASEANEEGSYGCCACTLAAGGDLILGPFNLATYPPPLVITHTYTTDVVMAVVGLEIDSALTQTTIPGCTTAAFTPTTIWWNDNIAWAQNIVPGCTTASSTPFSIVGSTPPAPLVVNGVETLKIIILGQEPQQTFIINGIESKKIIVLGSE